MFQFDTYLFSLQLLPLKTDVYFSTIQENDIKYAKRTPGCKQPNFMGVIVTPGIMVVFLSWLTSKIRMNREKNGGHFSSFHLERRPRDQI
jgi:hypothetical protein